MNHSLHKDRDEITKYKAFLLSLSSQNALISLKMKFLLSKFLYKKYGPMLHKYASI